MASARASVIALARQTIRVVGKSWEDIRNGFVSHVAANLVTAAIFYLIANGSGLVPKSGLGLLFHNTTAIAVAFVVIAWAGWFALAYRETPLDSGKQSEPSTVVAIGALVAVAAVVLEILALVQTNGWWTTTWVTIVSVLVGAIPVVVIQLVREDLYRRGKSKLSVPSGEQPSGPTGSTPPAASGQPRSQS